MKEEKIKFILRHKELINPEISGEEKLRLTNKEEESRLISEYKNLIGLKPMSFAEAIKAREPIKTIKEWTDYVDSLRYLPDVKDVVQSYENAANPKDRYKAESQLCRLVDRLVWLDVGVVHGNKGIYVAAIKKDGEYRIPHLQELVSQSNLTDIAMKHDLESQNSAFYISSIELVLGSKLQDQHYLDNRSMIQEGVCSPELIEKFKKLRLVRREDGKISLETKPKK